MYFKKMLIFIIAVPLAVLICGCDKTAGGQPPAEEGPEETPPAECSLLDYSEYKVGEDWAVSLQMALKKHDVVRIPEGRYPMSKVDIPSGKRICGAGEGTVIVPMGSVLFNISGLAGAEIPLAKDKEDFSNEFELLREISLKEGDILYLLGQRNCQILEDCGEDWCLGGAYATGNSYFFGEFLTVESADGKKVTVCENTIFPYYYASGERESVPREPISENKEYPYMRAASSVVKVVPVKDVTISDMTIEADGVDMMPISMKWAQDCVVENIIFRADKSKKDPSRVFINMSQCIGCKARGCEAYIFEAMPVIRSGALTMDNYMSHTPYAITSSKDCGFEDCYADGGSQSFLIVKNTKCGPSIGCYIKDCRAENALWSGAYIGQVTYDCSVTGSEFIECAKGVTVAGRKTVVKDNKIKTSVPFNLSYAYNWAGRGGTAGVMLNEGYSIDSVISGNSIEGAYSGILVADGGEETNIFTYGQLEISDNEVSGCMYGFYFWKLESNTGISRMQISIENNSFSGLGPASPAGVKTGTAVRGITLKDNEISGFQYGLLAEALSGDITAERNGFANTAVGISVERITSAAARQALQSGNPTELYLLDNRFENVMRQTQGTEQAHVILK